MANIQAIGVDGLTVVFLAATGEGSNLNPFKSIVSIDNFPSSFGATQDGVWDVSVNNFPTFTGLTNAELRADPLPVSGDFYPDTQLVSGTVTANTGLSQPITNDQLRSSPFEVIVASSPDIRNLSFATDKTDVSGSTVSLNSLPTGSNIIGGINNTGFNVNNLPSSFAVTGTFWQATQPVSLSSLPSLPTGSNVIGGITNTGFNVNNLPSSFAITASSLPLPLDASTATNQATIIGHVDGIEGLLTTIDGDTSLLSSTVTSSKLQVDVKTAPTITVADGGGSLTIDGVVELGATTIAAISSGGTTEITNDTGNPIPVSGTFWPTTQPVSLSSLPSLPTGSNTIGGINNTGFDVNNWPSSFAVTGNFYQATQPVSLASLPSLPTGSNVIGNIGNTGFDVNNYASLVSALQSATLRAEVANNVSVIGDLSLSATGLDFATEATQLETNSYLLSIESRLPSNLTVNSTRLLVDNGLSQGLTDAQLRASSLGVTVGNFPSTQPVSFSSLPTGSNTIGFIGNTSFDATQSGTWNINNIGGTISLPTGAAIASKQPSLGTAGTPSADVISVQGVSGGTAIKTDGSATTQPVSLTSLPSLSTGSNVIGSIGNTGFDVNNFPTTQAISAVSLPLPTDASTATNQTTANNSLSSIDGKLPSGLTVNSTQLLVNTGLTQPLTNTELRASAVPVSLSSLPSLSTGSNNIGSLTDITGTISLPTGAATATNQVTTNNSLSNVDGKLPVSLGQKVGTGSLSIVGASDWIGQTEILDNFGSPISITNPLSTQIFGQTPSGDLENFTINESGRLLTAPGSLTALGQLEVANRFPVVQADFVYGANTDIFSKVEVASGTVTKVSGVPQIKVSTGAASNSYAALYTQSYIKYRDGQGCEALIGCNFSTPAVGSIQFHGVGDFVTSPSPAIVNGYGFGYIDTTWGILWFNGASSLDSPTIFPNVSAFTFIPQSIFNVDKLDGSGPSGLTIDPLTCNLKQFKYPFLGVGNVFFLIEDPNTSRMIVCHIIRYPNSFTVPQLTNPNMRVLSLAYNSTNTSEVSVFASSVAGFIGGDRRFLGPRRVIESKTTLANQTETLLFAVRCNTTINSVRNTSQLRLFRWNGSNTGNNDVRIRIWKNPTITGGSYVNADATNSILATNTTGAYTVGTGRLIHSDTCTSGANFRDFLENLEAFLNPGETFAVTGQGGANSQVPNVSITFVEDI